MSWLTKVTDFAGKAEEMLNKLDQSTGDVIQTQKSKISSASSSKHARSSSYAQLRAEPDQDVNITEEMGRSGPSLPSRTHSEFAGGIAIGRKKLNESYAPSTSIVMERDQRDASLISMLNDDSISFAPEAAEETRSRRSSGRSVLSVHTTQSVNSEQPDVNQWKSQVWAKDSQISVMKTKIAELERKLEKRSQEYYELKAEKEMIEKKLPQQTSTDSIEELKLARKKTQEQKDLLMEECNQMKKKMMILEDEVRAMADQLRLAKFNLNENKKEFDEYKEKAQKILQAKEKLVESLKSEQGVSGTDRPGHLVQAELEEMKVERDLARADLEAAQLTLYNVRSELDELENQLRDEQTTMMDERRRHMEEKHSWQAAHSLLNEKIDCSRIEGEFVKQEMKRQADEHARRMDLKEAELRRSVEDQRSRRREEEMRSSDGMTAGEKLLQKQMELEEALRNNQILTLRLERIQKSSRETVIPMEQMSSASSSFPIQNPTAKKAITVVDAVMFKLISMLRNYPAARLFLAAYFVLLHFWVFFIILTYTPEMHDGHDLFTPPGGGGGGGGGIGTGVGAPPKPL